METNNKKSAWIILIYTLLIAMLVGCISLCFVFSTIANFSPVGIVFAIMGVIFAIICISSLIADYNRLVTLKNKVKESLSLIDIHLKLRFDLIPNLVETVKGFSKHEKEVLTQVIELRNLAVKTDDEKEKIEYANQLVPKMRQIIAIAENYPNIKADTVFKSLMEELVLIEDKIVASRRFYDSNVSAYNTKIEVWPSNIIAKSYGFTRLELFKIDAGENIAVKLNLGGENG